MAKKRKVYSAFILHDNQSWEQPSFSVPAGAKEVDIEEALLAKYGGFYVAGLQPDDDAPKACVEWLDVTPNKEITSSSGAAECSTPAEAGKEKSEG